MKIEDLELSVRTYTCLKRNKINTVDELCDLSKDDIIKFRNLGRMSLEEILWKMKELGLEFKGE